VSVHSIELECFEVITDGGVRKVSWQIEQKGTWVPIGELGGAVGTLHERAPGTVWRRRFVAEVAAGTRLMRVDSGPAPDVRRDPMDYLLGSRRSPRRLVRSYFVVGERGKLVRQER
jgi:hypothetical protein